MYYINFVQIPRKYANRGQERERIARFNLTGMDYAADNIPATVSADVLNIQIKGERSTVAYCEAVEGFTAEVDKDAAELFAYVMADMSGAYIMEKHEYIAFCTTFATFTHDSRDGRRKMRLKSEGRKMRAYLNDHAGIDTIGEKTRGLMKYLASPEYLHIANAIIMKGARV